MTETKEESIQLVKLHRVLALVLEEREIEVREETQQSVVAEMGLVS